MTREEAKEYFGVNFMEPTLENLFKRGLSKPKTHCKVGATYMWKIMTPNQMCPEGDWVYVRLKRGGWARLTCVARRSGVAFIKIEGDPSPAHEEAMFEDSFMVGKFMPEYLDIKAFRQNAMLDFAWKTYGDKIKIVNGYEED